jgi:hypothetical protein
MMIALLFTASLTAQSATCSELKHVVATAAAEGIDVRALQRLEQRTCAGEERHDDEHERMTPECVDLTIMSTLGRVAGHVADGIDEIDALRSAVCAAGLTTPTFNWKSGITARAASGAWNWPSGITAKYATGAWNWPSGITAKYATGAWNWPSGITARYANGNWNDPRGVSAAKETLLAPLCARSMQTCRQIGRLERFDGDLGTALLLVSVSAL